MIKKDARIKLVNEVLNGIKVTKINSFLWSQAHPYGPKPILMVPSPFLWSQTHPYGPKSILMVPNPSL